MQLSILIPSRNEMFLKDTVEDIVKNREAETEVIVLLDGQWADPPVPQLPNVNIIYVPESVGQRGAANMACKLAKGKYVMKVDAHCSFDQGFDRKMLEAYEKVGDDVTMVPIMRNLHAFNWRCKRCGWTIYQGREPKRCGWMTNKDDTVTRQTFMKNGVETEAGCGDSRFLRRKMVWVGKPRPQSTSFCFDSSPHFQYFREYMRRPEYREMNEKLGLTETMSLQGSAFMLTREKYWELNICGEELGNWGNQGIEVACKTWLSGGRVICNHNTWYSHLFRTQGGDFGFPYPMSGRDAQKTKENVKNLLWGGKFDKQIHPVSWLVEKFWPVPGWTQEQLDALKANEKATL